MAEYKYVNTNEDGVGEYSDTPGKKSRVIGGKQSKAGAGRGGQGGPTAEQAEQNTGTMSSAEKAVREEQDFDKWSKVRPEQKYAKGGSASARADGIASRGKTRGTMIAMCGGGMYKK